MYFCFEDITIAYGGRTILRNLNFELPRGAFASIIGPNGCGKSSLIRTLFRTVRPVSGRVIFDDRPMLEYSRSELAQRIAYLAQRNTAPPDMDVETLVSCGRYPYRTLGRGAVGNDRAIIEHALELTDMKQLKAQRLDRLSGGELQRAWIAMCVAQEPELFILDEPTTYLDIGYQLEIMELIRELNRQSGITILTVLHDLNLAARYSELICAICDGTVYSFGAPCEVLTEANIRGIFGIEAQVLNDPERGGTVILPIGRKKSSDIER